MAARDEHEAAGTDWGDRGMRDAILDAALSFICSTDKDLELCDRDDGGTRQVDSATWKQLLSRVRNGTASVSCVIDFAYSDGGRLKGNDRLLERAYCFMTPSRGTLTSCCRSYMCIRRKSGGVAGKCLPDGR